MKRRSSPLSSCAAKMAAFGLFATVFSPTVSADTLGEAFKNGETKFSVRTRHEGVDQDGFDEDAAATTLRARLSYSSAAYRGFSLVAEADAVVTIFDEDFNSGAGTSGADRAQFPVIADPDGSEINQAFLQYKTGGTALKLGRQRILLDNQRFVGGVGWRQNEQTYDAFSVSSDLNGFKLFGAYVDNVNRIFGGDVAAGDHDSETILLNASREFAPGKLTAYYYGIDNNDAAAFSTDTLGLRWNGSTEAMGPKLAYTLEFADQKDAANNPIDFDASYWRADGTIHFRPIRVLAGIETLEGDADTAGQAFRTPLATLHAFNGWADTFLATPAAGLQDVFVGAGGKAMGWNWLIKYHDFETEDGEQSLGSEIDAQISRKFADHYSVLFKLASFNSDSTIADTDKFWLQFLASF